MKTKFKPAELLVIYWHDITSVDGWLSSEDAATQQSISAVSVGWFVNDDDDCIRITNTLCDDQHNILVIPKGVIDKVKLIKYDRT